MVVVAGGVRVVGCSTGSVLVFGFEVGEMLGGGSGVSVKHTTVGVAVVAVVGVVLGAGRQPVSVGCAITEGVVGAVKAITAPRIAAADRRIVRCCILVRFPPPPG